MLPVEGHGCGSKVVLSLLSPSPVQSSTKLQCVGHYGGVEGRDCRDHPIDSGSLPCDRRVHESCRSSSSPVTLGPLGNQGSAWVGMDRPTGPICGGRTPRSRVVGDGKDGGKTRVGAFLIKHQPNISVLGCICMCLAILDSPSGRTSAAHDCTDERYGSKPPSNENSRLSY